MRASRPYLERLFNIAIHVAQANTEYKHPFLHKRETVKRRRRDRRDDRQGPVRRPQHQRAAPAHCRSTRSWSAAGVGVDYVALGSKGLPFVQRIGGSVVASVVQLGDRPHLDRIVGPVKVAARQVHCGRDRRGMGVLHVVHQHDEAGAARRPHHPGPDAVPLVRRARRNGVAGGAHGTWDYIYEPDARTLPDELMRRYIEAIVYQALAENMGSEQSARMVAMKAATDNAGKIIDELQLIYNKTRQAAITKELSEIVAGAAAV